MRRLTLVVWVALALAIGCAAGTAYHSPHAQAQAPAPAGVQKWQIRCFSIESGGVRSYAVDEVDKPDGWNRTLARLGAEGWDPVSFVGPGISAVCMKRAMP